jgi:hypothetical protein
MATVEIEFVLRNLERLHKQGLVEVEDFEWFIETTRKSNGNSKRSFYRHVNSLDNIMFHGKEKVEKWNRILSMIKDIKEPWLRFSASKEPENNKLVYPFQVELDECVKSKCCLETDEVTYIVMMSYNVRELTKRLRTVERLNLWDNENINFAMWFKGRHNTFYVVTRLVVAFDRAGVTSKEGLKWLLDGLHEENINWLLTPSFLIENYEDFLLRKAKTVGLENHSFFELIKRVKSNQSNWIDLADSKRYIVDDEVEFYMAGATALDLPIDKIKHWLFIKNATSERLEKLRISSPDDEETLLETVTYGEVRRKFKEFL